MDTYLNAALNLLDLVVFIAMAVLWWMAERRSKALENIVDIQNDMLVGLCGYIAHSDEFKEMMEKRIAEEGSV